jgi:hypothetical protein
MAGQPGDMHVMADFERCGDRHPVAPAAAETVDADERRGAGIRSVHGILHRN